MRKTGMNRCTLIHLNGKYYIYTVTVVNGEVSVNFERIG